MADAPNQPQDLYSIVVLGGMNPSIHHPLWYENAGLIDRAERDAALAQEAGLIMSPPISQFNAPGFSVVSTPDRWEVRTTRAEFLDRILSVAVHVFTELPHTPVSAYGFNFHLNCETGVGDVDGALSDFFKSLPLGLTSEGRGSAEMVFADKTDNRRFSTKISASKPDGNVVRIHCNVHRSIIPDDPSGPEGFQFDLGVMLREDFWPAHARAKQVAEQIAAGIPKLGSLRGSRG